MELLRKGKVKEVYVDGDNLRFVFTDQISVFDKIIPTLISGKGSSLCMTSRFWFDKLSDMGIKTHLVSTPSSNEMIVRRFKVIERYTESVKGDHMIPLEFIVRYYVAGSLFDRLKSDKLDFRSLGFSKFPHYGERLPNPFFEVTTKFESYDRPLTRREAMEISGMDENLLDEAKELILKIDSKIEDEVSKRGLIHVDGKKELAITGEGELVVIDTFGTADEDRFWDAGDYSEGRINELSKEFVRNYYRSIGYHDELYEAREKGLPEPDIPPLPDNIREETEKLYRTMYTRITGNEWTFGP